MKYVLEIYYQGDIIERREQQEPFFSSIPGDQLYIAFENSTYSDEYGFWWTVKRRSHILLKQAIYTLILHCEPNESQEQDYR